MNIIYLATLFLYKPTSRKLIGSSAKNAEVYYKKLLAVSIKADILLVYNFQSALVLRKINEKSGSSCNRFTKKIQRDI